MITIEIKSDTPLTDPHFDVLHRACREVAEATGQMVRVVADFTVAPPEKNEPEAAELDLSGMKYSVHSWPDINDWRPKESTVKDSLTDGWTDHHGQKISFNEGTLLDIKNRSGSVTLGFPAEIINWTHDNRPWDVVAFRPHKPEVKCTITTSSLLKDQAN